jgi:hypothetical protein
MPWYVWLAIAGGLYLISSSIMLVHLFVRLRRCETVLGSQPEIAQATQRALASIYAHERTLRADGQRLQRPPAPR